MLDIVVGEERSLEETIKKASMKNCITSSREEAKTAGRHRDCFKGRPKKDAGRSFAKDNGGRFKWTTKWNKYKTRDSKSHRILRRDRAISYCSSFEIRRRRAAAKYVGNTYRITCKKDMGFESR